MNDSKTVFLICTEKRSSALDFTLEELSNLVRTLEYTIMGSYKIIMRSHNPSTYISDYHIERIKALMEDKSITDIVIDGNVSSSQLFNLGKVFKKTVLSREDIVISIFEKRATTKEAKIQVQLAQLNHELPKLKNKWTHFYRQKVSASGHLKGEGEKQIELDRRYILERIHVLKKSLLDCKKSNIENSKKRENSNIVTVSLVGYTNVGKSSIFNMLTNENVYADDLLFATLSNKTSLTFLKENIKCCLIDTIGFISKLKPYLIAPFESSLKYGINADVLVHVIDASNAEAIKHIDVVEKTIGKLAEKKDAVKLYVLNKMDIAKDEVVEKVLQLYPDTCCVSIKEKETIDRLSYRIMGLVKRFGAEQFVIVPLSEQKIISNILTECLVYNVDYFADNILIHSFVPRHMLSVTAKFIHKKEEV